MEHYIGAHNVGHVGQGPAELVCYVVQVGIFPCIVVFEIWSQGYKQIYQQGVEDFQEGNYNQMDTPRTLRANPVCIQVGKQVLVDYLIVCFWINMRDD